VHSWGAPLAVSLYGHTPELRFLAHLSPLSSRPGHPEGYAGPGVLVAAGLIGAGQSEGSEPSWTESSDPMREAGAPNTERVASVLSIALCPPHRG
jgi:hypothetical protein